MGGIAGARDRKLASSRSRLLRDRWRQEPAAARRGWPRCAASSRKGWSPNWRWDDCRTYRRDQGMQASQATEHRRLSTPRTNRWSPAPTTSVDGQTTGQCRVRLHSRSKQIEDARAAVAKIILKCCDKRTRRRLCEKRKDFSQLMPDSTGRVRVGGLCSPMPYPHCGPTMARPRSDLHRYTLKRNSTTSPCALVIR